MISIGPEKPNPAGVPRRQRVRRDQRDQQQNHANAEKNLKAWIRRRIRRWIVPHGVAPFQAARATPRRPPHRLRRSIRGSGSSASPRNGRARRAWRRVPAASHGLRPVDRRGARPRWSSARRHRAEGIGLGGEYGQGALRIGGQTVGYYSTASASIGLQLGVQQRSQIIAFLDPAALEKFRLSSGWEIGVDASVTVVTVGAGGSVDASLLNQPIVAFVFDGKGLMYNLSLEGSKISRIKN